MDTEKKRKTETKTHHEKTQEADTETVAGESPCGQHGPASALPFFQPCRSSIILFPDLGLRSIWNGAGGLTLGEQCALFQPFAPTH
jgi:hypothetical protein